MCILFLKPEHQQYQIPWKLVINAGADSGGQAGPDILHF